MAAYYNEHDPYAAQWLRNLIEAGHIAPGDVDGRSIVDVRADDLRGYEQCHFFAGIGGWSLALRLAGWPDDRPVWTGSCPCQPFSAAGAGKAADDERHLWPAWFPLIAERCPPIVFGEQVEAAIGWGWLDAVFADLEAEGYACGAAVLPACGVGAPHIRQRTWFVADAGYREGTPGIARVDCSPRGRRQKDDRALERSRQPCELAHANGGDTSAEGLQRGGEHGLQPQGGGLVGLGDAYGSRQQARNAFAIRNGTRPEQSSQPSLWSDCDWLPCTDGKARPVEPGTFPLAHGIPGRVGRLRAYGNAIVPQTAAEFIAASVEAMNEVALTQDEGAKQ